MKKPVRVAVTGPAGNIGYALLFRIAAGDMLGPDQPVILQLLERNTPESAARLKGVMMELADCAFPLLADMTSTADPMIAFKDADAAILVGARPRTKGMERSELLSANGAIFTEQGKALDAVASRNVKVLVVGNPCNTNAYIAMKSAPSLSPKCFSAMLRLDHNRALSQLSGITGKPRCYVPMKSSGGGFFSSAACVAVALSDIRFSSHGAEPRLSGAWGRTPRMLRARLLPLQAEHVPRIRPPGYAALASVNLRLGAEPVPALVLYRHHKIIISHF